MRATAVPALRFGLEEEVFLTYPDRPTLDGFWPLARLLWSDPHSWYARTASNFARGRDRALCLMSGVEIATAPAPSPDEAVSALALARRALAERTDGWMVAMGALPGLLLPTNTCGLHVHVGGLPDRLAAYRRLARFLPLILCALQNSPDGRRPSYRLARSYAIGPLTGDPADRFQDLILPRRLPTVEIRAFDSTADLARIGAVLRAVEAIVSRAPDAPLDVGAYARLRAAVAERGYGPHVRPLYLELRRLVEVDEELFRTPPAGEVVRLLGGHDPAAPPREALLSLFSELDRRYRASAGLGGAEAPGARRPRRAPSRAGAAGRPPRPSPPRAALGLVAYGLPKLPYVAWKAWVENGGRLA
ncbi:MAG: hypothetical protein IRZ11_00795 [Clostridia bacterium]|nr:hypothetical protein [Clostridia bacterium]